MRIGTSHGTELITVGQNEELVPEMVYQLSIRTDKTLTDSQVQTVTGKLKNWLTTPFYIESKGTELVMQFQAPYHQQMNVSSGTSIKSYQLIPIALIGALPAILQVVGATLVGAALYTVLTSTPKYVYLIVAAGIGILFIGPLIPKIIRHDRREGESRFESTARTLRTEVPQRYKEAKKATRTAVGNLGIGLTDISNRGNTS